MDAIARWTPRQWGAAAVAAVLLTIVIGAPTDVIPNPVFGRSSTPPTWWSYPVLAATAVLGGLLIATYVRPVGVEAAEQTVDELDRPGRAGSFGGLLGFFAVGCPTCNKLVVVALGSTGALDWFAPAQPLLAVLSLALLVWALHARLAGATACRIDGRPVADDIMAR